MARVAPPLRLRTSFSSAAPADPFVRREPSTADGPHRPPRPAPGEEAMPEPEQQPDLRTPDGSTPPSGVTLDIAGAEHVTQIRRRFEEAWRRVQDGDSPPR